MAVVVVVIHYCGFIYFGWQSVAISGHGARDDDKFIETSVHNIIILICLFRIGWVIKI